MIPRQALLTSIQGLEIRLSEVKRDFQNLFPRDDIDDDLWNSRSYPGGSIQSMEQDIERLRVRITEKL